MDKIIFTIKEDSKGGFTAKSIDESIFTEGNNLNDLKQNIRNAIICHFAVTKPLKISKIQLLKILDFKKV